MILILLEQLRPVYKKLCPKCFDFIIIRSQIFQAKNIETIVILLVDKFLIKLYNTVYALDCNFNLIFFGQLRKNITICLNKQQF